MSQIYAKWPTVQMPIIKRIISWPIWISNVLKMNFRSNFTRKWIKNCSNLEKSWFEKDPLRLKVTGCVFLAKNQNGSFTNSCQADDDEPFFEIIPKNRVAQPLFFLHVLAIFFTFHVIKIWSTKNCHYGKKFADSNSWLCQYSHWKMI